MKCWSVRQTKIHFKLIRDKYKFNKDYTDNNVVYMQFLWFTWNFAPCSFFLFVDTKRINKNNIESLIVMQNWLSLMYWMDISAGRSLVHAHNIIYKTVWYLKQLHSKKVYILLKVPLNFYTTKFYIKHYPVILIFTL